MIAAILSTRASTAAATASVVTTAESDQAISVAKHVDCERQCPYYYFPICATNGNPDENRMFVNICEMHAWNCDVEKSKWRETKKKSNEKKNTCILQTFFPSADTTFRLDDGFGRIELMCICALRFVFSFSFVHFFRIEFHRTRNNQCKDYHEYVDDLWLNSHKPTKKPKPFTQHQPQTVNRQ